MLTLIKSMNKKKRSYMNAFDKRDPALNKKDLISIYKIVKIINKSKNTKMSNMRYITLENNYSNSSWSKLAI